MNPTPLVSIIMPAYNAERFIQQAIESVAAQTYPNWELLIVNDCSKDQTKAIVESLMPEYPQIRFFDQPSNQGVAAARNRAIIEAYGEYIAYLDSDDAWRPNKLERQLQSMQEQNASVCYTAYQRIDADNKPLNQVSVPTKIHYDDLLKSNFIGNLTGIYNAKHLDKCFLKPMKHEDYVAWLSLVKKAGHAIGINEILADYRVYGESTSANKFKTIAWQWKIYRQSENLGLIKSIYYMLNYAYFAVKKRT